MKFLRINLKEENNEFFGDYAQKRIDRAYTTMQKIISL